MSFHKQFVIISSLLVIPLCSIFAQREVSYRNVLDDNQVPIEVRAGFKSMYPQVFMGIWYTSHITYWYEDYAPSWYGAWYPARTTVVHRFEKPAYYEVDFQQNGEPSRAIFSRYGQWFETRTKIKSLPEEVSQGLKDSEFGDWLRSDHKERIESMGVPGFIFRLQVTNRKSTYLIRLNESGEIIQVKYE